MNFLVYLCTFLLVYQTNKETNLCKPTYAAAI